MKKKLIIFGTAAIIITVVAILALTNMFTKGVITGTLYRVDNVYEEIYNMVISERNGGQTILTTSIKDSEIDYDFGFFENIQIPVNDDYTVSLSFVNQDELCIWLFNTNDREDDVLYVYDYQNNILYGKQEEDLLIETFIMPYYSWARSDGRFNPEDHGNYTFVYAKYPLSHD